MEKGRSVFLKLKDAQLVKKVGVNPIYLCNNKYYVGLETLCGMEEEMENSVEFSTLELAEEFANELPS